MSKKNPQQATPNKAEETKVAYVNDAGTEEFVDLGIPAIDPAETVGQLWNGYFLGAAKMPAAYARQDLGEYFVAVFMRDDGTLCQDVLRTITMYMRHVPGPMRIQWENKGKRGTSYDIRVRRSTQPIDKDKFVNLLLSNRIPFDGSVAALLGRGEDCAGVMPDDIREFIDVAIAKRDAGMGPTVETVTLTASDVGPVPPGLTNS